MNQTEKKKKAILETTFELLNEKEIKDITVEEIAQRAVVSKVTLFKYFQSKNALMNRVILQTFDKMADEIEGIIQSQLDFEATYRAITDMKVKQLERYSPVFTENIIAQYAQDPHFINQETVRAQLKIYEELFKKGQIEGKIAADFTQEDFLFILNIFSEGMKGVSADILFKNIELMTRFFLNGWK